MELIDTYIKSKFSIKNLNFKNINTNLKKIENKLESLIYTIKKSTNYNTYKIKNPSEFNKSKKVKTKIIKKQVFKKIKNNSNESLLKLLYLKPKTFLNHKIKKNRSVSKFKTTQINLVRLKTNISNFNKSTKTEKNSSSRNRAFIEESNNMNDVDYNDKILLNDISNNLPIIKENHYFDDLSWSLIKKNNSFLLDNINEDSQFLDKTFNLGELDKVCIHSNKHLNVFKNIKKSSINKIEFIDNLNNFINISQHNFTQIITSQNNILSMMDSELNRFILNKIDDNYNSKIIKKLNFILPLLYNKYDQLIYIINDIDNSKKNILKKLVRFKFDDSASNLNFKNLLKFNNFKLSKELISRLSNYNSIEGNNFLNLVENLNADILDFYRIFLILFLDYKLDILLKKNNIIVQFIKKEFFDLKKLVIIDKILKKKLFLNDLDIQKLIMIEKIIIKKNCFNTYLNVDSLSILLLEIFNEFLDYIKWGFNNKDINYLNIYFYLNEKKNYYLDKISIIKLLLNKYKL